MKKLMMMLFAATLALTAVQAQDGRKEMKHKNPEEKAQMMTERMQKNLSLTDAQVMKIKEIYLAQAQKMAAIHESSANNKEAAKAEKRALREETQKGIAAVLTKEQLAKLEQIKTERKEKGKGNRGHQKGEGRKGGHKK